MLSSTAMSKLPVAILGGGPIGLVAAAHLIERGIDFLILEAGPRVGAHLLDYGHVRLFSPWRYDIDPAVARQLDAAGWQSPPADELPLAREIVERVLEPFAALPAVEGALHLDAKVVSVSREGFDKVKTAGRESAAFVVRATSNGQPMELRARAIIDATGTWSTPNPIGADGLPALGEPDVASHVFYGIPDVLGTHWRRYEGKRTLVVGAGHSAANALLSLAELAGEAPATELVWTVRSPSLERVFGGGAADALPARGQLGLSLEALRASDALEFIAGLRIRELRRHGDRLSVAGLDAGNHPLTCRTSTKSSAQPASAPTWASPANCVRSSTRGWNRRRRSVRSSTPMSTVAARCARTAIGNSRTPNPACTRSASSPMDARRLS